MELKFNNISFPTLIKILYLMRVRTKKDIAGQQSSSRKYCVSCTYTTQVHILGMWVVPHVTSGVWFFRR